MLPTLLIATAFAAAPPTADNPGEARPHRAWDITDVALDVVVDLEGRALSGTVVHTVVPLGAPEPWLRLHQVGLSFGTVLVDGTPVTGLRLGPGTVDIPVLPGAPHVVQIAWTAKPHTGVHFRDRTSTHKVVEAWTQGEDEDNRHWFPGWDHPSDTFTVTTALTVPDGLLALGNGTLQSKAPAEGHPGHTRWTYRLDQPIVNYLIAFTVGDYAVYDDASDVPIQTVVPRTVPEATARNGASEAAAMMPWMAGLLGEPYPYAVYRQVYTQRFMYGGMENATLTTLADSLLVGPHDVGRGEVSRVVAHELAHQWFGDLLTTHGWRELWLNEGFATFYAARWSEHLLGDEEYAAQVRGWAGPARSTHRPMANRGWAKPGAGPHAAQYVRGATVLHMLRTWLGDDLFDAAIRRYVADHRFSLVETADLRQAFEAVSGHDLRWFFDRWVHAWGAPKISSRWSTQGDTLTVSLRQSGDVQPYEGPLRIDWGTGDGTPHTKTVWLAPDATTLQVEASDVAWVAVDAVGGVLAHWDHTQPAAAWAQQATQAPTAHARFEAIEHLGDPEGQADVAVPVLGAFLQGQHRLAMSADAPFDTQRLARAAAHSLGELGTPEARDALLDGLKHPGAIGEVRQAIASALGQFGLDDVAVRRLQQLVGSDPLPGVQARALLGLMGARPSVALQAARTALSRPDKSLDGDLTEAALDVLTVLGEASDVAPSLAFVNDRRRDVQHTAGQAAVALANRHEVEDGPRARIAGRLLPWLTHDDLRTRRFAILLLSRLGAPEAVPALRAFAATSTVPEHRDAARAAITSIRAHDGKVDDPDALKQAQATLEALQERLDEVEERLSDLETW